MQRLLQPEDVIRRDRLGKPDAPRHVVRCVHVQHQHHAGPDRGANGTDPRHLVRQRQRPRLQLYRAVAIRDEPTELLRARLRRFAFAIVATRRIGEDLGARATEQPEHRQSDRLALQIPQRDVDAADGRHGLRPLDAGQRRRHAVPAANAARPRRGQREQKLPDLDVSQRIHPRNHPGENPHQVADQPLRSTGDLAKTHQPLVGAHLHQHNLVALHPLMRRPAWLGIGNRQRVREDLGDFHALLFSAELTAGCV